MSTRRAIPVLALCLSQALFAILAPCSGFTQSIWNRERIDVNGDVGAYNSLRLDRDDLPVISYRDASNSRLKVARYVSSAWVLETVDSATPVAASPTSVAIDSLGAIHVAYTTTAGVVRWAKRSGASWNAQDVQSDAILLSDRAIAIDDQNNPHIAYRSSQPFGVRYARLVSGAWQTETVSTLYAEGRVSLALNGLDRPHIGFHNVLTLYHAKKPAGTWTLESGSGFDPCILVTPSDYPLMSITDAADGYTVVYGARDNGFGQWGAYGCAGFGSPSAGNSSVAFLSTYQGWPDTDTTAVSYYDVSAGNLRFVLQPGPCGNETADGSANDVGRDNSIDVDDYHNVHISYYDATNGDLMLAVRGSSGVPYRRFSTCAVTITQNPTRPDCISDFDPDVVRLCPSGNPPVFDTAELSVVARDVRNLPAPDANVKLYEKSESVNLADGGSTTTTTDAQGEGTISLTRASGYGLLGLCVAGVLFCELEVRSPDCAFGVLSSQCPLPTTGTSYVNANDKTNPSCGFNAHFGVVTPGVNNWWDLDCNGVVNASDLQGTFGQGGYTQHVGHGAPLSGKVGCVGALLVSPDPQGDVKRGKTEDVEAPSLVRTERVPAVGTGPLGVLPNPARAERLTVNYSLSADADITLSVVDTSGDMERPLSSAPTPGWGRALRSEEIK